MVERCCIIKLWNMGKLITKFKDGSFLEYDHGSFDEWCVYLTRPNIARYAPRDYQYFSRLVELNKIYGSKYSLYADFVSIYNLTTSTLEPSVFDFIKTISAKYIDHAIEVAIDFSILYMGMVAEENKAYAKLGKRIKRLGVYQILIDKLEPMEAANFSKGKKWRELDKICKMKGF